MLKTTIRKYLKPQQLVRAYHAANKAQRQGKLANVAYAPGSGTLIVTRHVTPRTGTPKYALPAQGYRQAYSPRGTPAVGTQIKR